MIFNSIKYSYRKACASFIKKSRTILIHFLFAIVN